LSQDPWNLPECLELYSKSSNEIPITKLCFDNEDITRLETKELSVVVDTWPSLQRQPSIEFSQILHKDKPLLNDRCLSYGHIKGNNHKYEWRKGHSGKLVRIPDSPNLIMDSSVYVILDETHRSIYISNLKVASSTITELLLKNHQSYVLKICGTLLFRNNIMFGRMNEEECDGKCHFTCRGVPLNGTHLKNSNLLTTDLPDKILEKYLVFSFVRDPLTRVLSSYFEATIPGDKHFGDHLEGYSSNVHYRSQSNQLLGSQSQSGKPIKIDFIGKIENFDEDWRRLQVAMEPSAVKLTPQERLKLIPPSTPTDVQSTATHKIKTSRTSGAHSSHFQPYTTGKKFIVKQEVEVCRRYLQDFICFDYDIPKSCLDFAKLVYGSPPL